MIKNLISKLKQFFFNLLDFGSFKKGVKKAYSIPLLPAKISNVYDKLLVRVLRFLGGLCLLLILSGKYNSFYLPTKWVILMLGTLQILQIIVISIIKVVYGIRKTIYNSNEFEVRNSPLNHYASLVAKYGYCWRYGCSAIGGSVGLVAGGAAVDQLLEEAGKSKVFLPFMAKGYNLITGDPVISNPQTVYDNYIRRIKELSSAEERCKFIEESLDKINKEELDKHNIGEKERASIKEALTEIHRQTKEDKRVIVRNIINEIENLRKNNK